MAIELFMLILKNSSSMDVKMIVGINMITMNIILNSVRLLNKISYNIKLMQSTLKAKMSVPCFA